ncbi:MAG: helix-turn-helix transcriptional regulator [Oscillospiraceae bacterium]
MAVFKRIRDLREDHDLTQEQVAQELKISQRSYSYYENGQHSLTAELLIALADFYGVSVDYILNRK